MGSLGVLGTAARMPVEAALEVRFGVCKQELTSLPVLALAAGMVQYLGRQERWRAGCA